MAHEHHLLWLSGGCVVMAKAVKPDWIALDWSARHLVAWAMDGHGTALDEAVSDSGAERLAPAQFEPALLGLVAPWLGERAMPVLACGLIGAREGWTEVPCRPVPCAALSDHAVAAKSGDPRLTLRIVPGLRQERPAPDIMQGGESRVAGFLAGTPGFDGVICLPGGQTRWVHVSAGEVVSFQTFLTGEIFAALTRHSVLNHSVTPSGWDRAAFAEALSETLSRPERLAARLHTIRAAELLHGSHGGELRARLSGFLIGAELAAARPYWLGQQVVILGKPDVAQVYAQALAQQGLEARCEDGAAATRAGLAELRAQLA